LSTEPNERRHEFDFASPDGQIPVESLSDLILELRAETVDRLNLYERTLGLAVVPVLIMRAIRRVASRRKR
jgi:hypothetical protein